MTLNWSMNWLHDAHFYLKIYNILRKHLTYQIVSEVKETQTTFQGSETKLICLCLGNLN
jgi:hypothetical protein